MLLAFIHLVRFAGPFHTKIRKEREREATAKQKRSAWCVMQKGCVVRQRGAKFESCTLRRIFVRRHMYNRDIIPIYLFTGQTFVWPVARSLARSHAGCWMGEFIYGIQIPLSTSSKCNQQTRKTRRDTNNRYDSLVFMIYYILFWIAPVNIKYYYVGDGDVCVCVVVDIWMDLYEYTQKLLGWPLCEWWWYTSRALYNNKQPP